MVAEAIKGTGVCFDRRVSERPDSGLKLAGLTTQGSQQQLELAAHCDQFAPLGYLGVDLVLDAVKGPRVLELNARSELAL